MERHLVLTQRAGQRLLLYLSFLMLDKSLLSLCYVPGTVLGEHTGMNTTDLIPALMKFTVYQERLMLNKLNCYSWAKSTKEKWMMRA